jgi:uncharacterized protein (TIGR04255 family)
MVDWPILSKAPVAEGLIDIRAQLSPSIGLNDLESLASKIGDQYPSRRDRVRFEGEFRLAAKQRMQVEQKGVVDGYLFTSADGRQVLQARLDGFTLSRFKPYRSWQGLREDARNNWRSYCEVTKPKAVSRLAVRYINRVELPLPITNFKDYFLTAVEIAPGLPQNVSNFLVRLVIPVVSEGCTVILTETMEPAQDGVLPFILDIDVFTDQAFEPQSEAIWGTLDRLRSTKNDFFFRTLTPRALELLR